MPLKFDVFGYKYDDAEPAFGESGYFYYHYQEGRLYKKTALDAKLAAEGKSFGAGEIGPLNNPNRRTVIQQAGGSLKHAPKTGPAKTGGTGSGGSGSTGSGSGSGSGTGTPPVKPTTTK